ncbi:MAG: hypothetical protein P4L69_00035 [Desulfosporosinus sp.]|nr:hypothetical protein [Desulfosporosinus sp.]
MKIIFIATAVMAVAVCIATSVIASKVDCKSTQKGKDAYHWAWATAVVSAIVAAGSVAGVVFL